MDRRDTNMTENRKTGESASSDHMATVDTPALSEYLSPKLNISVFNNTPFNFIYIKDIHTIGNELSILICFSLKLAQKITLKTVQLKKSEGYNYVFKPLVVFETTIPDETVTYSLVFNKLSCDISKAIVQLYYEDNSNSFCFIFTIKGSYRIILDKLAIKTISLITDNSHALSKKEKTKRKAHSYSPTKRKNPNRKRNNKFKKNKAAQNPKISPFANLAMNQQVNTELINFPPNFGKIKNPGYTYYTNKNGEKRRWVNNVKKNSHHGSF